MNTGTAPRIVIVPGWKNSGPEHWQTQWQAHWPHAERVEQSDWWMPKREAWVQALEAQVLSRPEPVVIVAHSLGCITTAHLGEQAAARVQAALLVAPADPERRGHLADFAPVPYHRLPYRSVLVASTNDPFCPIRLAGAYARAWGSEFVRLPGAGHINAESGYGHWPLGRALLQSLLEDMAWGAQEGVAQQAA